MDNKSRKSSKYTVTVDGEVIGTRSSPRAYTHAVVSRWNPHKELVRHDAYVAEHTAQRLRLYRDDYARAQRDVKLEVGTVRRNHNGYMTELRDWEKQMAQELLAKHATVESYLEAAWTRPRAEERARLADDVARYEAGERREPKVVRWSQSLEAAVKAAASEFQYADNEVVVVDQFKTEGC